MRYLKHSEMRYFHEENLCNHDEFGGHEHHHHSPHESHRHGRGHGSHRHGGGGCERPGSGHGRSRAKRGAVRLVILASLQERPNNGYGIIKAVAEKTDGRWEPSPGAIYPAMQQLTEEGLITPTISSDAAEVGTYSLTPAGLEYISRESEKIESLWQELSARGQSQGLRPLKRELFDLVDMFHHATDDQRRAAMGELDRTKKALHTILAKDHASKPDEK